MLRVRSKLHLGSTVSNVRSMYRIERKYLELKKVKKGKNRYEDSRAEK